MPRVVLAAAAEIILKKNARNVIPAIATVQEIADKMHIPQMDAAFEMGRIDMLGLALVGKTINGFYIKLKEK